jgi:holo-[acyl-carrier protein] synthase
MVVPWLGTTNVYGRAMVAFASDRVGVDLVDVREVAASVERFGDRYLSRVFTRAETNYALAANDPIVTARRLAARFAAKEATVKALTAGDRGINPRDIEVVRLEDGAVVLALSGAAFAAAREAGGSSLALSVSHEGPWAIAVVIARTVTQSRGLSRIRWKP